MSDKRTKQELQAENEELQQRLTEAEETLRAIGSGEVDALVTETSLGQRVFTLQGADTVYRTAIENINEGAVTLSPDGTILFSNKYFAQMMHADLNKVIGTSMFNFIQPESHSTLTDLLAQEKGREELTFRTWDGSKVPAYAATIQLNLGKPAIVAVVTDLTEQKKNEEVMALKDRLAEAQRLSHTGSWEWNIKSGDVRWSDEMYAVLGVDKNDFVPDIDSFTHFIHVDDLPAVTKIMGKLTAEGGPLSVDFRIVRPDGAVRFLHAEGSIAAFDEAGKPLLMIGTDQDITELRRAEEAIKESEEKYRRIVETTNEGIMVADTEGTITFANPRMAGILGYAVGELIGKHGFDLVDPSEIASGMSKIEKRKRGVSEEYDIRFRHKNGSIVWLHASGTPISDAEGRHIGNMAMYTDITERKKGEEALKESEEQFKALSETSPIGVGVSSAAGVLLYTNPSYDLILGYNHAELIGKKASDLYWNPEDRSSWHSKIKVTGAVRNVEVRLKKKDGKLVWVSINASPVVYGSEQAVMGTIQDITERKEAEESLKRYAANLEIANKELESFSYSISHDLRAPLRGIDGFSDALLEDFEDKLDEKGKDYLNRIRSSSQLMSQYIDGLLKLSKTARLEMHPEKINLSGIVLSISEELKRSQPDRNTELIIPQEIVAYGDRSLLDAVMRNLLENAWKFTAKCSNTRIEFGLTQQNGKPVYYIKDNGVGFDMKYSDKLFKVFSRLHNQNEYPGTGIGLANVQRIVRRHGGQIWAESKIGKGTTFYFTLNAGNPDVV